MLAPSTAPRRGASLRSAPFRATSVPTCRRKSAARRSQIHHLIILRCFAITAPTVSLAIARRPEERSGHRPQQTQLFYDFCLDEHVPSDHLLRAWSK